MRAPSQDQPPNQDQPHVVVDGGDRACGELLLVLAERVREVPPLTRIRLFATDPAAAIDLPAWCHLTGHQFLGARTDDDRASYDVVTVHQPRPVDSSRPWRVMSGRQLYPPN